MRDKRLLELMVLSLLAAVMFGLKMMMAAIPNIEPVSLLVIVYTLVFKRKALYSIYIYVGLEILVWGFGVWNIGYLYIWLVLYLLTRLFEKMKSRLGFAVLGAAFGLAFGLLYLPVSILFGGISYGISSYISGIPYDIIHCVGNFVMVFVLQEPLTKVLKTLKIKYLSDDSSGDVSAAEGKGTEI